MAFPVDSGKLEACDGCGKGTPSWTVGATRLCRGCFVASGGRPSVAAGAQPVGSTPASAAASASGAVECVVPDSESKWDDCRPAGDDSDTDASGEWVGAYPVSGACPPAAPYEFDFSGDELWGDSDGYDEEGWTEEEDEEDEGENAE